MLTPAGTPPLNPPVETPLSYSRWGFAIILLDFFIYLWYTFFNERKCDDEKQKKTKPHRKPCLNASALSHCRTLWGFYNSNTDRQRQNKKKFLPPLLFFVLLCLSFFILGGV